MRWSLHATPPLSPTPVDPSVEAAAVVDRAVADARRWAAAAGVEVREVATVDGLREVSALLVAGAGRSPAGVSLTSEVLRTLVHAGGCVLAAFEPDRLVGAAALTPAAPDKGAYGLIAAVDPALADRGIGLALKQAQRAWALGRGYDTITWTFDPLSGRNARFNLVKLGATATAYATAFYGPSDDGDEADRLVVSWPLTGTRAQGGARGEKHHEPSPGVDRRVLAAGPDHEVMAFHDAGRLWVRVPRDILAVRRDDPAAARAWRTAVRAQLEPALSGGGRVVHLTRDSWYVVDEGAETH